MKRTFRLPLYAADGTIDPSRIPEETWEAWEAHREEHSGWQYEPVRRALIAYLRSTPVEAAFPDPEHSFAMQHDGLDYVVLVGAGNALAVYRWLAPAGGARTLKRLKRPPRELACYGDSVAGSVLDDRLTDGTVPDDDEGYAPALIPC